MSVRFSADGQDYTSTSSPPASPYTVLCWVRIAVDRNTYSTFWSTDANNTSAFNLLQTNSDGTQLTMVEAGTDILGPQLTVGTWYRVAVTRNGGSVTLYSAAAGAVLASLSSSSFNDTGFTHFRIGESSFAAEWLNGNVANLKHYDVVLTVDEIEAELAQYQPVRTAGLVRWHPLVSAEQTDYSGNARTLSGGTGASTEDGPPIRWARARGPRVKSSAVPQQVAPSGIPSAESLGTPTVSPGVAAVSTDGIPSEETFGTPQLTTGPVQVFTTGIPSAETFGTPSIVSIVVGPIPGIPSSEAVGSPTLTVGAVQVFTTGIPSAETFGTPAVTSGTVQPGGIPSAESFGSPTFRLAVVAVGIPSAGAVGSPTVTPGGVAMAPSGIASGEEFGSPLFTITLDASVRRGRPVVRRIAAYELVAVARIPQTVGPPVLLQIDPIDWVGLSYSDELSKPQRLDASCKIATLTDSVIQRLEKLSELATELWLYRDGRLVFAGPWLGWSVQGETLTMQASGLLSYLKYMVVTEDLTYTQQDQFTIVKGLIDHWQNQDYGNFGIDTGGNDLSGQLRDATYLRNELHPIAQRVEELGRRENGFDLEVDPASRRLRLWFPGQGVDRSSGEDAVVFDARNVTSTNVSCSVAPGDVASEAIGTGTGGETIYSAKPNLQLRAQFGRSAVTASFDGVSEQSTLDAHLQGLLDARSEALLIPGPEVRTVPDADLSVYGVGDTVNYQLHARLGVRGAFRLRKRQVSVSNTGVEKASFEFV